MVVVRTLTANGPRTVEHSIVDVIVCAVFVQFLLYAPSTRSEHEFFVRVNWNDGNEIVTTHQQRTTYKSFESVECTGFQK